MNRKQQRIYVGALFAIFLAVLSQIIDAAESVSHTFDWDSFTLEVFVILIIAGIGVFAFASK